jgi:hypothetical protein
MSLEEMVIINRLVVKKISPYAIIATFSFSQNVWTTAYATSSVLACLFTQIE